MKVMITGATSGIGKELSLLYADSGADVIACGRNTEKLSQLASQSSKISPLCFELTDFSQYPEVDDDIDLLIFNAGDCQYIDNPVEFDGSLFEKIININLISIGHGLERWLKNIRKGGRVVFVSSSASLLPLPRAEAYGASKSAVTYLAKTLSVTLHKYEIGVTVVHPGFVDTPLTQRNNFPMPMLISAKQAAEKMQRGIAKGKSEISFPMSFVAVLKCLSWLPNSLWLKIATRMTS